MCTHRRLRSAWASAQSDRSLRCPQEESLGPYLPTECTAQTDKTWRFAGRTCHFVGFVIGCINLMDVFVTWKFVPLIPMWPIDIRLSKIFFFFQVLLQMYPFYITHYIRFVPRLKKNNTCSVSLLTFLIYVCFRKHFFSGWKLWSYSATTTLLTFLKHVCDRAQMFVFKEAQNGTL